MNKMKRFIAIVTTLCLTLALLSATAWAYDVVGTVDLDAEAEETSSGSYDVTYTATYTVGNDESIINAVLTRDKDTDPTAKITCTVSDSVLAKLETGSFSPSVKVSGTLSSYVTADEPTLSNGTASLYFEVSDLSSVSSNDTIKVEIVIEGVPSSYISSGVTVTGTMSWTYNNTPIKLGDQVTTMTVTPYTDDSSDDDDSSSSGGSGSSGGSSGSGTDTSDTTDSLVVDSSDDSTVTVTGSDAAVEAAIEEAVSAGTTVTVDLSEEDTDATSVTISSNIVETVAESEAEGLEIILPDSSAVSFDSDSLSTVAEEANGQDIQLVVQEVPKEELNDEQAAHVEQAEADGTEHRVIEASLYIGNTKLTISNLGGRTTVTFFLGEDWSSPYARVYHLNDAGSKDRYNTTHYSDEKGHYAQFTTTHFSYYLVEGSETDANSYTGVSTMLNTEDHNAYMQGSDGSFKPDDYITRAEVAQMFYNLLLDQNVTLTATFSDVASDAWYATAVNTMASLGILEGTGSGLFEPTRNITRAEFATIAVRFAEAIDGTMVSFDDVPESHWAYEYIATAYTYGWVEGVGDNLFMPDQNITRAAAATMTNRMLDRQADEAAIDAGQGTIFADVTSSHWAWYEIAEATTDHDYTVVNGTEAWVD